MTLLFEFVVVDWLNRSENTCVFGPINMEVKG
jgi:hypothetical protein